MPMKWTGRDIANLMRNSNISWNSGALSKSRNFGRTSHCAVGQLARVLGADAEAAAHVDVDLGLGRIFGANDSQKSKNAAADNIERLYGNAFFDVENYEKRIREYMKAKGKNAKPNCEVLEKVKALHVEPNSK